MKQKLAPLEIARQTLMLLSKAQKPPTPENFRRVYDQIAGVESVDASAILNKSLEKILLSLGKDKPKFKIASQKITSSLKKQDLISLESQLRQLISAENSNDEGVNWATLLRYMLKQLEANHTGLPFSRKKDDLNRVIQNNVDDTSQLAQKIQVLITSWGEGQAVLETAGVVLTAEKEIPQEPAAIAVSVQPQIYPSNTVENQMHLAISWRDMLIKTMHILVLPLFSDNPAAASRIQFLIEQAEISQNIENIEEFNEALKSTLLRAEMLVDTQHRMQESLIRMLRLLVTSMGELAVADPWLLGQVNIVKDIISNPLNIDSVSSAEGSLKELIFKQSSLKPGLLEAKDTIKNMMSNFVNSLVNITESTGTYQTKINEYQTQIATIDDLTQLNTILQNLVGDIREMSTSAQNSHEALQDTQKTIENAESHINELTVKLDYISQVAQQDFLTGALNRRGMEEAIEREFNRADRHHTPLSIAMIDIDHFKKINDTMGHSTGDTALAHLAKVVKSVIRSTDVLARYGGEEFVILLPGSKQEDAVNVVTGVQRNLTKNFFLHDNNSVLITFSAGVAERMPGEHFDDVLPRADAALYVAKQTGRNRVVGAKAELPIKKDVTSPTK